MAASASDVSLLRKMIAEPTTDIYSDVELTPIIEKYPLDTGYDLNAAARDVWELKAATFVTSENQFSADGLSVGYGDRYDKAMKMARFYDTRTDEDYQKYGFGYLSRDDVDPLGNGDYRTRPVI